MCVHTTWPLVKVSPAMAENVMLFFRHQIKNLCFIMLVVLVITVPMSSLPWVDSNHRPHSPQGLVLHRLFRWDVPLLSNTLPIELHDMPYIFILHTSSWQPHQPTTHVAEPIRTIGLAIRIPYFNSFRLLLCHSNHSAFNSHNFPRSCTTTYPYVAAQPQPNALTRKAQGFGNYLVSSGCTYGLDTVSFHSICIEVSFDAVSAHGFARPFRITRHHSCHCVFSIFSLLAGIARCTSLGVCGRCRIRTCDVIAERLHHDSHH